jgi:hypothetical protein
LLLSSRIRRAVTVAATAAVTLTMTFVALPANAVEPIVDGPLALPSVSAFVVDGAHHHLLFGSGTHQNGVLVTDLSGTVVTTLAASGGINDISIAPGGVYAYAASPVLDKIYQINLATLTVSDTFSMPAGDCPVSVAVVSATYVAFGYTCDSQFGGVGVLNTSTRAVNVVAGPYYNPFVRAVPNSTQFISGSIGEDPAQFGLWNAGTGTPVAVIGLGGLGTCENLGDIAVSPDGSSFVVACGYPYFHAEYATADFSPVATYVTNAYPTAAAFSPDGNYLAAGMDGQYKDDVAVFHHTPGDTTKVYSADYADDQTAEPTTPPHGVAFSADSTQLYALADDTSVSPAEIYLLTLPVSSAPTYPPPPPVVPPVVVPPVVQPTFSTLSLAVPSAGVVGHPVTVAGTLRFANGSFATNDLVTVTSSIGGVVTVGQATVDASGGFSYTEIPSKVGLTTVTASYAGDARHFPSRSTTSLTVTRAGAKLGIGVAHLRGKVYVVTAHLTSWGANRKVKITANNKVIANAKVNAKGLLVVRFTRKLRTSFVASFVGDANDYSVSMKVTLR